MEMEAKIKEVENYFKAKIFNKDFEVKNIKEHTMAIIIDEKYIFTIWIGNFDYPNSRYLYESEKNYMDISFNVKERLKLHSVVKKYVLEFQENTLKREKMKEFNKLKKELNL